MSRRSILLKGTLILTLTGLCTRVMGFFYRIFLSHTFGEEGMGIYQLVFPVYALGFSLTCAGIQTILSRLTAKNTALGKEKEARELLYSGLLITVFLSCIVTLLLQKYANFAAVNFLKDPRCEDLLILLSYVFPFAAVHSCICGYYFGRKETGIPAVSQLLEQSARIAGVLLIYHIGKSQGVSFQISLAVIGLILGELASSSFCLYMLRKQETRRMHTPSFLPLGLWGADRNGSPLHPFSQRTDKLGLHHASSRSGGPAGCKGPLRLSFSGPKDRLLLHRHGKHMLCISLCYRPVDRQMAVPQFSLCYRPVDRQMAVPQFPGRNPDPHTGFYVPFPLHQRHTDQHDQRYRENVCHLSDQRGQPFSSAL